MDTNENSLLVIRHYASADDALRTLRGLGFTHDKFAGWSRRKGGYRQQAQQIGADIHYFKWVPVRRGGAL